MRHPLLGGFAACPERVAFAVDGAAPLTYGELDRRSRAWAAHLQARGVSPGDRVAVQASASVGMLVATVAHLRSGIVHVPINTRYRDAEILHILEDSGAAALVADADSPAAEAARRRGLPCADRVLDPDDAPPGPGDGPVPRLEVADDTLAMLIYTSGTTGRSKGVALTHRALVSNIGATTALWRWTAADRLVLALPLFHVHGLGLGVLGTLLNQMSAVVHRRFDAARVVDAIGAGGTMFMGVPTMYARLLAHLDAEPGAAEALRGARLFTSGSAALPAAHHEAFAARTGHAILERYGMSETGFTLSNPYEGERRPGSVGFAVPGYEVRVVQEDRTECAAGEVGEIWVRGDGLMAGYWGLPDATEASSRGGWFMTGDLATVDEGGYHRIVGRRSVDIIKSGGFKLSTREIEDVILTHPAVAEAAVYGLPDAEWGERVAAAIVLEVGAAAPSLGEVAAHVAASLADYKQPRRLEVLDALPRNALGKVQKHRLMGA